MDNNEYVYVGIDLGTTYSSVGHVRLDGQVEILKIKNNFDNIRSVVSICANNCLVGDDAVTNNIDSNQLIYEVKRFMGKEFKDDDEKLKKLMELTPNKFVDIDGKIGVEVSYVSGFEEETIKLTPEQVSTLILMKLKQVVEKHFPGKKIKTTVGVPAAFTDTQRDATRNAVKMAGMECIALINEPTAASRAGKVMDGTVFVFDFGGGTLDISIVEFKDGIETVKVTKGNPFLGGNNIDYEIMKYIENELRNKLREEYPDDEDLYQLFERFLDKKKKLMKDIAEKLKKRMSEQYRIDGMNAEIEFTLGEDFENLTLSQSFGDDSVEIFQLILEENYTLSYKKFEEINIEIFNSCRELIRESIQQLGSKNLIDRVLLVGGSCKNPQVEMMLINMFGREKVVVDKDIESLVTIGLARRANLAEHRIVEYSTDHGDVITHDIEIKTIDPDTGFEDYIPIIEKNQSIPCHIGGTFDGPVNDDEVQLIFHPYADNMTEMEFELFESRKKLYTFTVKEIPALPRGTAEVKLIIDVGTDGKLKIQAREMSKKRDIIVTCEPTISNISDEKLKELGKQMEYIFKFGAGNKKEESSK